MCRTLVVRWVLALGLALVLLPALVACSKAPPADTAQGRCEQQVNDDPAVKAILVDAPSRGWDPIWQAELNRARRKSVYDCLAAAGVAPRGGVEPVEHAHYGLGWF